MKCPCEKCICLAICKHKPVIRCSILYDKLVKRTPYEVSYKMKMIRRTLNILDHNNWSVYKPYGEMVIK